MNTASVKRDLLENYKESKEYREAFVYESVYAFLAFQLRALREQREWSQKRLGREAGMAQERVSILEDPNAETKPTLNTLLRLADAFDVGLDVRFVPFRRMLDGSFNNSPDALSVPSFVEELRELERTEETTAIAQQAALSAEVACGVTSEFIPTNANRSSPLSNTPRSCMPVGLHQEETSAAPIRGFHAEFSARKQKLPAQVQPTNALSGVAA